MADQLAGYWYRKTSGKKGLIETNKVLLFMLNKSPPNPKVPKTAFHSIFQLDFVLCNILVKIRCGDQYLCLITRSIKVVKSLRTIYKHNVLQFCDGKMGAVNGYDSIVLGGRVQKPKSQY